MVETFASTGFWVLALYPLGPVQLYSVAPVTVEVNNSKLSPSHIAPLFVATGICGGVMVIAMLALPLTHPLSVATTLYTPAFIKPALVMVGFASEEVKLFGPVQLNVAPAVDVADS